MHPAPSLFHRANGSVCNREIERGKEKSAAIHRKKKGNEEGGGEKLSSNFAT